MKHPKQHKLLIQAPAGTTTTTLIYIQTTICLCPPNLSTVRIIWPCCPPYLGTSTSPNDLTYHWPNYPTAYPSNYLLQINVTPLFYVTVEPPLTAQVPASIATKFCTWHMIRSIYFYGQYIRVCNYVGWHLPCNNFLQYYVHLWQWHVFFQMYLW